MSLRFQIFSVIAGAITALPLHASIVSTMNPVADAFVSTANPGNNYGAGGALSTAAAGLPNGEFQTVIRFDTAAAKVSFDTAYGAGQWSVQDVTLTLTAASPNNVIFNPNTAGQFSASWMQNDSWAEGTGTPQAPTANGITYNTLPNFLSGSDAALGTYAFPGGTSGALNYAFSLPVGLQNDILGGNLLSLRLFASDATLSYLFNSRSNSNSANRPILTITATPEPTSALLLTLAAVAVLSRSRRRR